MKSTESKHTTQRSFTAPAARWSDGDWSRNIVLVVVHEKSQWAIEEL